MKINTLLSIKLVLSVFYLLTFSNSRSQNNNNTSKTVFGKTLKTLSTHPTNGKIRCATTQYEQFLQDKNPKRMTNTQFENWLAPLIDKRLAQKSNSKTTATTVYTIPVVVHVIHNGQAIGTAPNITDAQVQSQITVLNQDFRRKLGTPGYNTNPIGADVQIEFVLATQDPKGNPSNGIDRINMCQSTWTDEDINDIVKPASIWNPNEYLNMWTVRFDDDSTLGYAQFPSASGLPGIAVFEGEANTDGVVSSYNVFGSKAFGSNFLLQSPYNGGRTMTHEVGHYLGLRHIWGDGNGSPSDPNSNPPTPAVTDCNASDYCADTPQTGYEHYSCGIFNTCPTKAGNDMPENYMDYTDDACMNIFTQNQKDRILTVLNNATRRKSLISSTRGNTINLFVNDVEISPITDYCDVSTTICSSLPNPTNKKVILTNRGTKAITNVKIKYSINGGIDQFQTWTGSLVEHQAVIVTLLNTTSSGVLNTNVATVNSVLDERSSNNTDSKSYAPVNYDYTNFVFTLQNDFWGSEVTWTLKDGAGTTRYSGGPYRDKPESSLVLPAIITQNWTLARNQCYTFSIEDLKRDGICCGGGSGYFNIKTANGTETIATGASYGFNDTVFFTTNSTPSTAEFETSQEVFLYPNPTRDIVSIQIPTNLGLPTAYNISNVLGQSISQKDILNQADLIINTANLSNGVYFITISKANTTRTLQFIKE